jgi:hypothetical protein
MPVNRRIQFVVELVSGHDPEVRALDELAKLAARYGERPAVWAPSEMNASPRFHYTGRAVAVQGTLDPETTYVYVGYVGNAIAHYGLSFTERIGGRQLYVILINQERHRPWRPLLPERILEQQTLVHEYGHMLGLPPADHGYFTRYPSFYDGAHCVNPSCALSKVRPRAALYAIGNTLRHHFLDDYCVECRRAIDEANRFWRQDRPRKM